MSGGSSIVFPSLVLKYFFAEPLPPPEPVAGFAPNRIAGLAAGSVRAGFRATLFGGLPIDGAGVVAELVV
jgi:hypothetical protein